MGYIILGIVVLAFVIIVSNITVVQQSKAYVIERLGAFQSVWGVGLHFKVPFIDRVARRVSMKEQVLDYPPQPVITKDNVTMQIDTVVYFQIPDPKLYCYGVEQPMMAGDPDGHHPAEHHRRPGTGPDPDQPGRHQHENALHSGRGHGPLGHQGEPGGAEKHPAASGHPELHGEADEGRA